MATYSRPTTPLSIAGVLDDGLRLYLASVKPLFALSLATCLALSLPATPLIGLGPGDFMTLAMEPERAADLYALFVAILPFAIAGYIVATFLYAAMITRLGHVAAGESSSLAEDLATGIRRGLPLLIGSLLYALAVVVGLILFVVPGSYLMVTLSFMGFPLVLERRGPIESLRISHRLVKGFWWRTATLVSMAVLIAALPGMVVDSVLDLAVGVMMVSGSLAGTVVLGLLSAVLYAVLLPILVCLVYSIYADLRLRKEGADLERRLETLPA